MRADLKRANSVEMRRMAARDTTDVTETPVAQEGRTEPPARRPRFLAPHRYVLRVLVFLALAGFFVYIFQAPVLSAFRTNPGLNGLICGTLGVGILMGLNELRLLYREAQIGNAVRLLGDMGALGRSRILSPLAALAGSGTTSSAQAATMLESIAVRLDDGREVVRYLAGLLVFLGLLGTFWGLLETVSSVGNVIKTLRTGGESSVLFDELKSGLAAPLAGMGLSFSSSLFGIAGSLVLGFIDLQIGQAQRRLRNQIEDWLGEVVSDESPVLAVSASGTKAEPDNRAATRAMANLAEGIQGLVQHMRTEQQLIRDWVEAQASREKELKHLLDRMAGHYDLEKRMPNQTVVAPRPRDEKPTVARNPAEHGDGI
jgi:hypothetical protein